MSRIVSSTNEDVKFDWEALSEMFIDRNCWLVILDDWQISLLLSSLRFAYWSTRWKNYSSWDDVEMAVTELEYCLMAGCNISDLQTKLDLLIDAIAQASAGRPPIVVNCATQGTGEEPPSSIGYEGEDPPSGWEEPSEIEYRKCKVANMIWDNVYFLVDEFDKNNVVGLAELGGGLAIALIIAVLALALAGPILVAIAIVGVISTWALALFADNIDLPGLKAILTSYQTELVCSLYTSSNAAAAREAFKATLAASGANSAQVALADAFLINDVTNSLFFRREDSYGDALEAALDGYTGTIDCGVCGLECPYLTLIYGGGVPVLDDPFTIISEYLTETGHWYVEFQLDPVCPCENYNITTNWLTGGPLGDGGGIEKCDHSWSWRWDVQGYGYLVGYTYEGYHYVLLGTGQFTVNVTVATIP